MQVFVHCLMPAGTWIGLTDKDEDGTWMTWDGKAAPYLHWGKGEPNNYGPTIVPGRAREDCAMLEDNNAMNDAICTGRKMSFVCQIADD